MMKDSVIKYGSDCQLSLVKNSEEYELRVPKSSLLLQLTNDEFLSLQDKVYTVSEHLFFNTNLIIDQIKANLSFLESERKSSNLNESLRKIITSTIEHSPESDKNRTWDICHFNFDKPNAEIDMSNRKINLLNPLDVNDKKIPLILGLEKLTFGNFKTKITLYGNDIRDFFVLFFEGDEIKYFDACCSAYISLSTLNAAIEKMKNSIAEKTHEDLMADIEKILIGLNSCRKYLG